jgi:hypothetical protein
MKWLFDAKVRLLNRAKECATNYKANLAVIFWLEFGLMCYWECCFFAHFGSRILSACMFVFCALYCYAFRHNSGLRFRIEIKKETETEPIIAYRCWRVLAYDGEVSLISAVTQDHWQAGEPMTGSPFSCDALGVHAVKKLSHLFSIYGGYDLRSDEEYNHHMVCGKVALWGDVVEHDFGYRAEFAYPVELWAHENSDPMTVMMLELKYGVPVTLDPAPWTNIIKEENQTEVRKDSWFSRLSLGAWPRGS